jgi:hypothetical protein
MLLIAIVLVFPSQGFMSWTALPWTPLPLLQETVTAVQILCHMISSCTAYHLLSASAPSHILLPTDEAASPPPYTLTTPPSPLSSNYVEQTRAADEKGVAISLTFRDWSCWDELGRRGEVHREEALAAGGQGVGGKESR